MGNVLWIGGGACGGKTTLTDRLAQKHGFIAYHPEAHYERHKGLADPKDHPAMLQPFRGWEHFFNRPLETYVDALLAADRERFEMVAVDVLKLSGQTPVVVDCHGLEPSVARCLATPDKVLFLFAEAATIRAANFARKGHDDMLKVIDGLKDPAKTRAHVLDVICETSARKLAQVKASGLEYVVRDGSSSIDAALARAERHFGLV